MNRDQSVPIVPSSRFELSPQSSFIRPPSLRPPIPSPIPFSIQYPFGIERLSQPKEPSPSPVDDTDDSMSDDSLSDDSMSEDEPLLTVVDNYPPLLIRPSFPFPFPTPSFSSSIPSVITSTQPSPSQPSPSVIASTQPSPTQSTQPKPLAPKPVIRSTLELPSRPTTLIPHIVSSGREIISTEGPPTRLNLLVKGENVRVSKSKLSRYANKLTRIIVDESSPFTEQLSYRIKRSGRNKDTPVMEIVTPEHHQANRDVELLFNTRNRPLEERDDISINSDFVLLPLQHPFYIEIGDVFGYYQYAIINRMFYHNNRNAIREYRIEPTYYHSNYYVQNYYRMQIGLIIFYRTAFPMISYHQALHHSRVTYGLTLLNQYLGKRYGFEHSMREALKYYVTTIEHESVSRIRDTSVAIQPNDDNWITIRRYYDGGSAQIVLRSIEPSESIGSSQRMSQFVTTFAQQNPPLVELYRDQPVDQTLQWYQGNRDFLDQMAILLINEYLSAYQ